MGRAWRTIVMILRCFLFLFSGCTTAAYKKAAPLEEPALSLTSMEVGNSSTATVKGDTRCQQAANVHQDAPAWFEFAEHYYQHTFLPSQTDVTSKTPSWEVKKIFGKLVHTTKSAKTRYLRGRELMGRGESEVYWLLAIDTRLGLLRYNEAEKTLALRAATLALVKPTGATSAASLERLEAFLERYARQRKMEARRFWNKVGRASKVHCIKSEWTELAEASLALP